MIVEKFEFSRRLNRLLSKTVHISVNHDDSFVARRIGGVMRLYRLAAPLAASAFLLSGCSWLGGFAGYGAGGYQTGSQSAASGGSYSSGFSGGAYSDPCQVSHAQAPIPYGCSPADVTISTASGGFPQTPQFGTAGGQGGTYASGGYGTHASGNHYAPGHAAASAPAIRKPRFRAALDLGLERNVSGNLLDPSKMTLSPLNDYDPTVYAEGSVSGSVADGRITSISYYGDDRLQTGGAPGPGDTRPWDEASNPAISFGDAWSTPTTIGLSGEFILSDRATIFGRAGYSHAEGNHGETIIVEGTAFRTTTTQDYDDMGAPVGGPVSSTDYVTEQEFAAFSYDFSDMERYDLEAGGRIYLDPIAGRRSGQTVTPFFGASAGASHYNAVSYTIDQDRQLFYTSVFDGGEASYYDVDRPAFDLDGDPATAATNRVDLYDSQWVPAGRLSAGVEWQVTSKTALALETGVRVEGARDYANGQKGDTNISVPLTLRGSLNF